MSFRSATRGRRSTTGRVRAPLTPPRAISDPIAVRPSRVDTVGGAGNPSIRPRHPAGLDAEILAEVAELLAGELVTNARVVCRDADRRESGLERRRRPRLLVKVCDEDDTMPQIVEPPRPAGHGGYGLRLLERFSNNWGSSDGNAGNASGSRWVESRTDGYCVS